MLFIEVNKFTIQRSHWSRGRGKDTCLLNEIGDMDCLGFFLKACGATNSQLFQLDEPIDAIVKYGWSTQLIECIGWACYQTPICNSIIATNDIPVMEDIQREQILIRLFKTIHIDLNFIN